jgi:hypothetical protein
LDKTKYLKTKGVDLAPKKINENDSFDLWVYGYDFDADEEKSEHEVFIETKEGKDKLIGGLAPKGIKRGTDANQCYIFKNLKWSEFPQKQLKVKIRNVPGDWVFSTVYAIYIMPHSQIDNEKAGDMIRNRRDRVQEDALGFVEFSHQGLLNRDDMTDTFIIDIPGSTKN